MDGNKNKKQGKNSMEYPSCMGTPYQKTSSNSKQANLRSSSQTAGSKTPSSSQTGARSSASNSSGRIQPSSKQSGQVRSPAGSFSAYSPIATRNLLTGNPMHAEWTNLGSYSPSGDYHSSVHIKSSQVPSQGSSLGQIPSSSPSMQSKRSSSWVSSVQRGNIPSQAIRTTGYNKQEETVRHPGMNQKGPVRGMNEPRHKNYSNLSGSASTSQGNSGVNRGKAYSYRINSGSFSSSGSNGRYSHTYTDTGEPWVSDVSQRGSFSGSRQDYYSSAEDAKTPGRVQKSPEEFERQGSHEGQEQHERDSSSMPNMPKPKSKSAIDYNSKYFKNSKNNKGLM
ncbi:MAG: hypothetical protein FWG30_04210 [Eubacteriaceae bacterium]|nr:hypothetical protein [Eubacteriaceae bacterium]